MLFTSFYLSIYQSFYISIYVIYVFLSCFSPCFSSDMSAQSASPSQTHFSGMQWSKSQEKSPKLHLGNPISVRIGGFWSFLIGGFWSVLIGGFSLPSFVIIDGFSLPSSVRIGGFWSVLIGGFWSVVIGEFVGRKSPPQRSERYPLDMGKGWVSFIMKLISIGQGSGSQTVGSPKSTRTLLYP